MTLEVEPVLAEVSAATRPVEPGDDTTGDRGLLTLVRRRYPELSHDLIRVNQGLTHPNEHLALLGLLLFEVSP